MKIMIQKWWSKQCQCPQLRSPGPQFLPLLCGPLLLLCAFTSKGYTESLTLTAFRWLELLCLYRNKGPWEFVHPWIGLRPWQLLCLQLGRTLRWNLNSGASAKDQVEILPEITSLFHLLPDLSLSCPFIPSSECLGSTSSIDLLLRVCPNTPTNLPKPSYFIKSYSSSQKM